MTISNAVIQAVDPKHSLLAACLTAILQSGNKSSVPEVETVLGFCRSDRATNLSRYKSVLLPYSTGQPATTIPRLLGINYLTDFTTYTTRCSPCNKDHQSHILHQMCCGAATNSVDASLYSMVFSQ